MMRAWVVAASLVATTACADIKEAPSPPPAAGVLEEDDGPATTSAPGEKGSSKEVPRKSAPASDVPGDEAGWTPLLVDRDTLGARAPGAPDRAWRGGLAAKDGRLYWLENGGAPGLYTAPASCRAAGCVERIAGVNAGVFAASRDVLYFDDVAARELKSYRFEEGAAITSVAGVSASGIDAVAVDGTDAIWINGSALKRTTAAGRTTVLANLAVAPIDVGATNGSVFWAERKGPTLSCFLDGNVGPSTCASWKGELGAVRGYAGYMYIASSGGVYRRTTETLGKTVVVGTRGATDFAFDATYAYWTEPGDAPDFANGRLRRVAHDGDTVEEIARGLPRPVALAIDGGDVYVACAGTKAKDWSDGAIVRVAR
ncbi:MAG: hypothetical protein KIT84_32565 [Labilithrix sp.]|nr:hypothetical protein [Labilithrix sp.]MCW5815808.1 hypothetical protein [Labilithrix sp.]